MKINYKKEEEKENVSVWRNKTKIEENKQTSELWLCRGDGGIPNQSAKLSRMDSTLQISSDLENAEINTNMQLYYSTMSE